MALYDEPALYDALLPVGSACVEWYVELARRRGGDVLELGCGTGQLAAAIVAAGSRVVG